MGDLKTVGDIARELGVQRSRICYAIQKVGILERRRVGIIRLFSADQVPSMRAALDTVRSQAPRGPRPEAASVGTS